MSLSSRPSPAPSHPSHLQHLFRSSESGRDSPRTLIVSEQLFKFHIETPPIEPESLNRPMESPVKSIARPLEPSFMAIDNRMSLPPQDPLFSRPQRKVRRSRRRTPALSPLEEGDTVEEIIVSHSFSRARSPPPLINSSDDEDEMMSDIRPPDEGTRYLRRKKRAEQVMEYRMRELRDDRDARASRRNNPLSPKASRVEKISAKKVKFLGV
jgi:hypothetical protein